VRVWSPGWRSTAADKHHSCDGLDWYLDRQFLDAQAVETRARQQPLALHGAWLLSIGHPAEALNG
jgi:hypothetical protein